MKKTVFIIIVVTGTILLVAIATPSTLKWQLNLFRPYNVNEICIDNELIGLTKSEIIEKLGTKSLVFERDHLLYDYESAIKLTPIKNQLKVNFKNGHSTHLEIVPKF